MPIFQVERTRTNRKYLAPPGIQRSSPLLAKILRTRKNQPKPVCHSHSGSGISTSAPTTHGVLPYYTTNASKMPIIKENQASSSYPFEPPPMLRTVVMSKCNQIQALKPMGSLPQASVRRLDIGDADHRLSLEFGCWSLGFVYLPLPQSATAPILLKTAKNRKNPSSSNRIQDALSYSSHDYHTSSFLEFATSTHCPTEQTGNET